MSSIADSLTRIQNAKDDLKTSINAKNAPNNQITNETIDDYASFVDLIPQGITPTGTITITQGGVYDVTNYASANVDIPIGPNEIISETYTWDNTYTISRISPGNYYYLKPEVATTSQPLIVSSGTLNRDQVPAGNYLVQISASAKLDDTSRQVELVLVRKDMTSTNPNDMTEITNLRFTPSFTPERDVTTVYKNTTIDLSGYSAHNRLCFFVRGSNSVNVEYLKIKISLLHLSINIT